jgi:transposase
MNFHLDALLNLPNITVESCLQQEQGVLLKLSCLNEQSDCPHCHQPSQEIHQNRPVLIRDLSVFGQLTQLQVPRRQFYCSPCQRYFTERLTFVDWERRYTQRYEDYLYHQVQASSIEVVSRTEALSWDQVQGVFRHKFDQEKKQVGEL